MPLFKFVPTEKETPECEKVVDSKIPWVDKTNVIIMNVKTKTTIVTNTTHIESDPCAGQYIHHVVIMKQLARNLFGYVL